MRKVTKLDRNRATELGPIYCEGCKKFFDDRRRTNILNFHAERRSPCVFHKGMEGYSLLDKLKPYKDNSEVSLLLRNRR